MSRRWRSPSNLAFAALFDATTGQPPPAFEPFCVSDGSMVEHTTACPCGNFGATGHGCANSASASGGLLAATGQPANDDVMLTATGLPTSSLTLFQQHDARADAAYHDGVICAGGNLIRLRSRSASGGQAHFPDWTFPIDLGLTLSQRGGVTVGSGVRRYYSVWYRDASTTFCPPATANVTNGWRIDW